MNFTVIDFETTGVDSDACRVTEIGLARFEDGQLVESCNYLINPGERYLAAFAGGKASEVSGITAEMLAAAPSFVEVWPRVADMFSGAHPMAYNAPFDRRFLQNEIRLHSGGWPANVLAAAHVTAETVRWIDPLPWVRKVDKYQRKKSLVAACERRAIPIDAHRAINDAIATGQLFLALQISDTDLLATQAKLRVQAEQEYHAYKNRKAGGKTLDGAVFVCDSCDAVKWSDSSKKAPPNWAFFKKESVTCSVGCDAQMLWWEEGRVYVGQ